MQQTDYHPPLIEPIRLIRGDIAATFKTNGELLEAHVVENSLMNHFARMQPHPIIDDQQCGLLSRYRNLVEVYHLRYAGYGSSKTQPSGLDRGIEDDYLYLTSRLTKSQQNLLAASFLALGHGTIPSAWIRRYMAALDALTSIFEAIDDIWEALKKTA